jgi:hypothetical protein
MNIITQTTPSAQVFRTLLIDLLALGFIFLTPAMSHLTGIPVYFIEPMRIMLVIALLFSNRYNAFALAVLLPVFSFLISGHPAPVKMLIISAELLLNAWLFTWLVRSWKQPFLSMLSSILISKIFCYAMYWVVFTRAFMVLESQTIFLITQLIVALTLSLFTAIVMTKQKHQF